MRFALKNRNLLNDDTYMCLKYNLDAANHTIYNQFELTGT